MRFRKLKVEAIFPFLLASTVVEILGFSLKQHSCVRSLASWLSGGSHDSNPVGSGHLIVDLCSLDYSSSNVLIKPTSSLETNWIPTFLIVIEVGVPLVISCFYVVLSPAVLVKRQTSSLSKNVLSAQFLELNLFLIKISEVVSFFFT